MSSKLEMMAVDKITNEKLDLKLPFVVVDDDFFEFLEEVADKSMDVVELVEYWNEWAEENVEQYSQIK
mgnify:FL=1